MEKIPMEKIPFGSYYVDLRVIKTEIGKVVPIIDISLALDLNFHELENIVNEDIRLYEGLIIEADIELIHKRALNNYGIVRLLTRLQFSYKISTDKEYVMKRLQEWTVRHLGLPPEEKSEVKNTQLLYIPDTMNKNDFMKPEEAAKVLGKSLSTIYRKIKSGKLKGYKSQSGFVLSREEMNRIASSYVVSNKDKDSD